MSKIIPANPGFYLARAVDVYGRVFPNSHGPFVGFDLYPVIGWSVSGGEFKCEADHHVTPIPAGFHYYIAREYENGESGVYSVMLKTPDGMFAECDGDPKDESEALLAINSWVAQYKAARTAKQQPIPPDTKARNGKHTYADMVKVLRDLAAEPANGRETAFKILDDVAGVKTARDMDPKHYDAVVKAAKRATARIKRKAKYPVVRSGGHHE